MINVYTIILFQIISGHWFGCFHVGSRWNIGISILSYILVSSYEIIGKLFMMNILHLQVKDKFIVV